MNVSEKEASETERRQITVLFCDLVGSTALASRLDPEDLREILVAYYRRAAGVIERWAGHVANYMGDGILAYFGYPRAHEDDAERAAQAGLELVETAAEFAQWDGARLQLRVGIATGLVVIDGIAGAQGRGATGETPNRAARLQTAAEPDTVVVDASTRRRLDTLFECRDLGPVEAKGLHKPVQASQVLRRGVVVSRSGAQHAATAHAQAMIGRDGEVGLLRRSWAQAKGGKGCVVLLSGEPGIGKSRLVAALAEQLAGEPLVCLRYFCSPQHQDSPLFPVMSQIEHAAGFKRDDAPEVRLGKLETLLAGATKRDDEDDAIGLVGDFMGLRADNGPFLPNLGLQRRRERLLHALLAQLASLAARQPVLMLFEDVHWIDPTSLEVLSLTVERIRFLPVLLVVTFRPEFHPPWAGLPHVSALTLGALGRREAAALAARVAGDAVLPTATVEQIVERTGGVPLFVEEFTRAIMEADWHDAGVGASPVPPAATLPACAVPAALYAPLAARLDRLGSSARGVAQVGAVIGQQFTHELLAAVTRQTDEQLRDALERLVEAGLVLRTEGEPLRAAYLFKHALVQDTAYGTLLRARRRELHATIAQAIADRVPDTAAAQPELLAHHYVQAGLVEDATKWWLRAGTQSLRRSATTEALTYLSRGLAAVETLPAGRAHDQLELGLRLAYGDALVETQSFAAPIVGETFATARKLCERLGQPPHYLSIVMGEWSHTLFRAELHAAKQQAKEILQLAGNGGNEIWLIAACFSLELTSFPLGDFDSVCEQARRGLAIAATYDRSAPAGPAVSYYEIGMRSYLSWALQCMGYPNEARRECSIALEVGRRLGHAYSLAQALWFDANCKADTVSLEAALPVLDELQDLADKHGFAFYEALATMFRGWSYGMLGDPNGGLTLMRRGLQQYVDCGHRLYLSSFLRYEAQLLGHAGQPSEGLHVLAAGTRLKNETGAHWDEAELERVRAGLLWACGRSREAEDACREAIRLAKARSARLFEIRAATLLAEQM